MRVISVCLNPTVDITTETDTIQPISKTRTRNERISPGGGGVNVWRVLGAFGLPCELVYLSGGITGKLLDEELRLIGDNTRCYRHLSSTRIAFTVHQSSNQQEYRFVPEGPIVDATTYAQCIDYLSTTTLQTDDMVVVSGSLPRGVPDTAYAEIAGIAADKRARLILDSSGPGLSATLASGNKVFIVKPSLNELQRLAGCKLDEPAAREFAHTLVYDGKADHVAVSMGSHGAFLVSHHRTLRLPAHLVKLQSAVGAGDSFVAAMVYCLALGQDMENAFRFGVAAGAAAVMTPGDQLCKPEDVDVLYRSGFTDSVI